MTKSKSRASLKSNFPEREVVKRILKSLKSRKVKASKFQIKKVWDDFIGSYVIAELKKGNIAWLDERTKIEIVGERIKEGSKEYNLLMNGKYVQNGKVRKINKVVPRRLGFKYKIEFETGRYKGGDKIYFVAHSKIRNEVHKALSETPVNYRIKN